MLRRPTVACRGASVDHTVALFDAALGPSDRLHRVGKAGRTIAAIGRWSHEGAKVDLAALNTAQLVFNLTGGQRLEWRSADKVIDGVARCGSVAVVEPDATTTLRVAGRADTLQIVLDPDLSASDHRADSRLSRAERELTLRALAAQALVALAEDDADGLSRIIHRVTSTIADPEPRLPGKGGIAREASCRAKALIERGLTEGAERLPSVADVADEAGLSIYHFIRAFNASEGADPAQLDRRAAGRTGYPADVRGTPDGGRGRRSHRLLVVGAFCQRLPAQNGCDASTVARCGLVRLSRRLRNFLIPLLAELVRFCSSRRPIMQIAKWMVAFVAIYNFGGILFDAVIPFTARMHLHNPAWPPHAKFHNGQTMLLGVLLGSLALAMLFGFHPADAADLSCCNSCGWRLFPGDGVREGLSGDSLDRPRVSRFSAQAAGLGPAATGQLRFMRGACGGGGYRLFGAALMACTKRKSDCPAALELSNAGHDARRGRLASFPRDHRHRVLCRRARGHATRAGGAAAPRVRRPVGRARAAATGVGGRATWFTSTCARSKRAAGCCSAGESATS